MDWIIFFVILGHLKMFDIRHALYLIPSNLYELSFDIVYGRHKMSYFQSQKFISNLASGLCLLSRLSQGRELRLDREQ